MNCLNNHLTIPFGAENYKNSFAGMFHKFGANEDVLHQNTFCSMLNFNSFHFVFYQNLLYLFKNIAANRHQTYVNRVGIQIHKG
jgi:hypothetical protein